MAIDTLAAAFESWGASATVAEVGATAVEAGAVYAGASSLSKKPNMPPSPVIPQAQVDQQTQQAENMARQRQSVAGGINSTVGTSGGQSGQILNPQNMQGKSLLGQ
jgi:hypothetical protein